MTSRGGCTAQLGPAQPAALLVQHSVCGGRPPGQLQPGDGDRRTRAHPSHCHIPDTARHPTPVTRRLSSAGVTTRHRHGDQCASDAGAGAGSVETPHQLGTSLVCYQLRGQVMVVWMVTPFTVVLIDIAPGPDKIWWQSPAVSGER